MKGASHEDRAKRWVHGRGSVRNPRNRFEGMEYLPLEEVDTEGQASEPLRPRTVYLPDQSKSILSYNDSPDVGFRVGVNPYRGCEHGCVYCYARPFHEYLGYSAGLDFETKIFYKAEAPELLRRALSAPSWKPEPIALSGATDCYQPIERRLEITRRCLEVLLYFRNPVVIITKNRLVLRDVDLLSALAEHNLVRVFITVTTLDLALNRALEPRSSSPEQRVETIRGLAAHGVPVGVLAAPIIPTLNEPEMPRILEVCREAGAQFAGYIVLRLPHGVADLFTEWLSVHYPLRKEKILNRIRSLRGGRLNCSEFGERMRGSGLFAAEIEQMFRVWCRRLGLNGEMPPLSVNAFRRPGSDQLTLEF
jgi:DNA repair photolyase